MLTLKNKKDSISAVLLGTWDTLSMPGHNFKKLPRDWKLGKFWNNGSPPLILKRLNFLLCLETRCLEERKQKRSQWKTVGVQNGGDWELSASSRGCTHRVLSNRWILTSHFFCSRRPSECWRQNQVPSVLQNNQSGMSRTHQYPAAQRPTPIPPTYWDFPAPLIGTSSALFQHLPSLTPFW